MVWTLPPLCFALLCDVFLGIGLFEKSAEVIELVFPEDAIEGEPVGGLLHRAYGETAHANAAGFFLLDEAGLFEDVEVLEDSGHRHLVGTGEFSDGGLAVLEGAEDGSTGGVAEGREGGVETG
jgi:hypothetical protein